MPRTRNDNPAVEVPVGTELRRLAAIIAVLALVGAAVLSAIGVGLYRLEQTITAVPGWGHCIIRCSGIPLSTVEQLSGVTFPKGSEVLRTDGASPGGIGKAWAEAYVLTPRGRELTIEPASTLDACFEPGVNDMSKWGVRRMLAGAVDGACIQYGITAAGDQIVHAYGARRSP
jgi:hypothetical protein